MRYYQKYLLTPLGKLSLLASEKGLAAVLWEHDNPRRVRLEKREHTLNHPILEQTAHQLTAYFAGKCQHFSVPLDLIGTEFQKQVWAALLTIPFGKTRSYSKIAAQIGRPKAVRAVGAANGRNPISIIVPCHRVIGRNGELTGFAGGMAAKAWLLRHEGGETT